ncbi:MAG: hypothetical protein ACQERX_05255, partial [Bacillota bacterium]
MRKRTKKFMGYINHLRSPYRIDSVDLANFLCEIKATGKVDDLLQYSEKELLHLSKSELMIEFDNLRNRVHSNPNTLYALFPDLDVKWLDTIT